MKILHLDIETSPNVAYVWRLFKETIPLARLIESSEVLCWSAKWDNSREIMFDSIYRSSRKRMLKRIHKLMDEADVIVHYNGNRFDIPVLNKEFLIEGMGPPSPARHIDLYRVVRKNFSFVSYKMDYVLQQLGLGKKKETSFELWVQCMERDPKAWRVMEIYNKHDVRMLAAMYHALLAWISNHPNHALYLININKPVCPKCGSTHLQKRGVATTNTQVYQRYQCQSCKGWSRSRFTEVNKDERHNILRGE